MCALIGVVSYVSLELLRFSNVVASDAYRLSPPHPIPHVYLESFSTKIKPLSISNCRISQTSFTWSGFSFAFSKTQAGLARDP